MLLRALGLATAACLFVLTSSVATATVQRTFVASTGNDANPCSLAQPCRGFTAAVAQTSSGGEVIVLDSAGYGSVVITKSVSIIAPPGVYAGISAFTGGIGVDGVDIVVLIRGLTLVGQEVPGPQNGISFARGELLTVEDCEISQMSSIGIFANAPGKLVVRNTILRGNNEGIVVLDLTAAMLDGVRVEANKDNGVWAFNGGTITIVNSVISNNTLCVSAFGDPGTASVTTITITRSTISDCQIGITAKGDGPATAKVVVDTTTISNTTTAAFYFGGGGGTEIIYTPQNNTIGFNNGAVVGGTLTPIGMY